MIISTQIVTNFCSNSFPRCYLLLQAFIVKAKLPISDYIGDSRSVLDQVPRLLAAAESIAAEDMMTEYSFDLFCMFSRTIQAINTRSMVRKNEWISKKYLLKC